MMDSPTTRATYENEHHKKKLLSIETFSKRLPILRWLPSYSISTLGLDIIAGITVGLTAIPQGIAYAVVAGLEPQYGLYSGFVGCFVYIFLGSCKDINIGPTAIMALMSQTHVAALGPDVAVLFTFLSGCIIFLFGFLHLGFLLQFISHPVQAAFTSAAAITIGCAQIKSLLGLKGQSNEFLPSILTVVNHYRETRWQDLTLGVISILFLLLLRHLKNYGRREHDPNLTSQQNVISHTCWVLSIGRNALVVIAGTVLAWWFSLQGSQPFKITGKIGKGLPGFQLPPFSTTFNNQTYEFSDMLDEMGVSVFSIPFVAILEHIAIAKSFTLGRALDGTQEMLALGLSNILGSFFRSMPSTGSFTRTAVNNASGVQTPLGGLFTGLLVLGSLGLLTQTFYFIPKATLAAVIITAMIFVVKVDTMLELWRTNKIDFSIFFVSLIICLFWSLDFGIIFGMLFSVVFLLYNAVHPRIHITRLKVNNYSVLLVKPLQRMDYPAAEYFRDKIIKEATSSRQSLPITNSFVVVIDGVNIVNVDTSVAKNLKMLIEDLHTSQTPVVLWRWSMDTQTTCERFNSSLTKCFIDAATLETVLAEFSHPAVSQQIQNII